MTNLLEGTTVERRPPAKLVCKDCGSDSGFREVGTVHCSASRDTRSIKADADGNLTVRWNFADVDDFDATDIDVDHVECRSCGSSAARVEDLAVPEHAAGIDFNPGDLVWLPDGLRAEVATVDRKANTFTVVGWHETFTAADAAPLLRRVA